MRLPSFLTSLLLPLSAAVIGPAHAYPGADAGPRPYQGTRGKPAPLATLKLLPPGVVLERLRDAGVPSSQFAFHVRRVDTAGVVSALNDEQPMVLASTAKVVTTLAALDLLGPDYRWTTRAYARGEVVDGRLEGDLLIVGGAGGTLRGRVRERSADEPAAPPQTPFGAQESAPLREVVREINKQSNNLLARNLWLTLAPDFPLQQATPAASAERVHRWLQAQGLKHDDMELDTGSGLSRGERARPRAMAQLLVRAWRARHSREFVASLPVAGVDGTLARRFLDGAATGHAYLKTGSLLDARALAGYVKGRDGTVYAVAAMINHPDAAAAVPALDALVEWVAGGP